MPTLVERMLDIADELIATNPRSSAARRRAVSTAYYAAFHALAKACASTLLPEQPATSASYERVYRTLEHGAIRQARTKPGPLKDTVALRDIFDLMSQLLHDRERADYLPPRSGIFSLGQVKERIAQARLVCDRLDRLSVADRIDLAVQLSTKERKGGTP